MDVYKHPQNVEKRLDNIYRGCCEWWTFRDTFLASYQRMGVPLLCVDSAKKVVYSKGEKVDS